MQEQRTVDAGGLISRLSGFDSRSCFHFQTPSALPLEPDTCTLQLVQQGRLFTRSPSDFGDFMQPSAVTQIHDEKETLLVDVNLPGHDERITTPLFTRTRSEMLEKIGHRCEISGCTEDEAGPVEFHHFFVERCLATAVDPERLYCWIVKLKERSEAALAWFDSQLKAGDSFEQIWADPYAFTDDMTVNGMGICKRLHTGKGEGIHYLPFPLWQLWVTGNQSFVFVGQDAVKDEQETQDLTAAELEEQVNGH